MRFSVKKSLKICLIIGLTISCLLLVRSLRGKNKEGKLGGGIFIKEGVDLPDNLRNFNVIESSSNEYDDFAFVIKSGADVFYDRIPGLLQSYPKYIKNKIIVGEKPGYKVGNYTMHDVCTPTYGEIKETYWSQHKDTIEKKMKEQEENGPNDESQGRKQDFTKLGWQLDVYKNIPAFKLLYDTYPNAKWYVMVDDDTYVFLSNLKKRLSFYDPDEKLYLGANWPIPTGCYPSWQNARFAHGGAGIILSHAAMLAFVGNYDQCVHDFDDCYAGDVRLALCLNTVGIRLNRFEHRHVNINWRGHSDQAPNLEYSWTEPCDLPLTFHHLFAKQQKLLFDIQRYHNRDSFNLLKDEEDGNFHTLISYSDVFNSLDLDLKMGPPEKATYRLGSDYRRVSYGKVINETEVLEENVIRCQQLCIQEMPKCKSWQYSNFMCHLKSGIPGAIDGTPNSYSGITGVPIFCDGELLLK
ncbi:hypothetical protein BCR36DRAFT_415674 [Piromyces finnis]|uniref:N-acetylgalactosaminide beta-1,3-galactosyltransferase n=1 Tax=Piromyces finnis TaxID=1754191 RepID=A0A1Y1V0B9_9FUNG|nr:hypothetical protein BCR36DRAFT_415674 [Piromyces finnis]|eukprot:ORX43262.1 hypothetical protein BCR36DRAFT_415674 [Piromyces finnis]